MMLRPERHWHMFRLRPALCVLTLVAHISCGGSPGKRDLSGSSICLRSVSSEKIIVYFFRAANFSGGGRIHFLKIDDRIIGELTHDNYYFIELWPGEYHASVFLPAENFLGKTLPSMSIGKSLNFSPGDRGRIFLCQYTDGEGTRGFHLTRANPIPEMVSGRWEARKVTARDSAQVSELFNARYDGPALNRMPHGEGTLTWPDGCVYHGRLEHGVPTNAARFIYSDGRIFFGLLHKGRPARWGVLQDPDGRILFAGPFSDEKPDGVGLRTGDQSPEFCVYSRGSDTTKSFHRLAEEALDAEDEKCLPADKDELHRMRSQRLVTRTKQFEKAHQVRIEAERVWCREEFALGRRPCTCAPLADDFERWQECEAPEGGRSSFRTSSWAVNAAMQ
jgi:hypothetical protein